MDTLRFCPQCQRSLPANAPEGLCPQCLLKAAAFPTSAPSEPQPVATSGTGVVDIGNAAEVAKRLPQFEILEMLGRGGMGVVYKARQLNLDRVVALKILPPVDAMSADFIERFRREARSLGKLSHPNIVAVHDFGESNGLYYFAMEFVDGVNLREMIRTQRMTPAEALAVVPKICDALQFAHEEGVVHRDIKPENILIDKRGRVKIADFGLAKLLRRDQADHTLTMTGMTLGTPRYMAPEQLDKPETVDHRADIYSLGVVFYEMLTGEVPMGRFAPPSEKVQVDVKLDEIVLRSLERDVERRYQHASEIKTDVESVTQASPARPAAVPVVKTGGTPVANPDKESGEEEGNRSTFDPIWMFVALGAVFLAFANPWGAATWYVFGLGCALIAMPSIYLRASRRGKTNAAADSPSGAQAATPITPAQERHLRETTSIAATAMILLGIWSFVVFVTTALPFYLSVRHFGQFVPGSPFDGMLALASLLIANCVPSALLASAWRQCSHRRAWMAALGFVGVAIISAVVQSRWGFHPVSVEIFFGGISLVCFLVLRFIPAMPAAFAAKAAERANRALTPRHPATGAARFLRSLLWLAFVVGLVMFIWFDARSSFRRPEDGGTVTTVFIGAVQPWLELSNQTTGWHTNRAPDFATVSGLAGIGALIALLALFSFRPPKPAKPAPSTPQILTQINARSIEMMIAGLALAVSGLIGFIEGMMTAAHSTPTEVASREFRAIQLIGTETTASRAAHGALLSIPFFLGGIAAFLSSLATRKLRFHPFALVMSILLMLALPAAILGMPALRDKIFLFPSVFASYAGLRAFLLLRRPETEAAFAAAPRADASGKPPSGMLPSMMIAAGILTILSAVLTALLVTGVFVSRQHFDAFFRQDSVTIAVLVMQTLALPCGVMMLIGGLNAERSPGFARTAAKLACVPLTPAWLFTLPMGIAALGQLPRAAQEAKPVSDEPLLSKCALWGMISAVLGLGAAIALAISYVAILLSSASTLRWPDWFPPFAITFASVAATAVLGATALGGVALGVIRRSAGKLYGRRLAAIAALSFPLLLFGVLVFAGLGFAWKAIGFDKPGTAHAPIPEAITALIVCGIAASIAWRKICGEGRTEKQATEAPATDDKPRLSRSALVGVLWAPWTLAGWWAWQHCVRQYFDRPEVFASYSAGYATLGVTAFVLAATAGVGSTILGGVAIAQIKHSKGKLYGLPMAACALLVYPLLLLGSLAFYLTNLIAFTIAFNLRTPPVPVPDATPEREPFSVIDFAVLDSLVALAVMFFAGRAAWRKISGYQSKADPSVSAPAAWMLVGAVASLIMSLWLGSETWQNYTRGHFTGPGTSIRYAALAVFAALAATALHGALKMLGKEDYAASRRAALCSIFSIFGIITLPAGIWSLARLSKPEVQALFPRTRAEAAASEAAPKPPTRHLLSAFVVLLMLAGFFFCFSFQAKSGTTAAGMTKLITVGAIDPIYISESGPSGFSTSLNFFSWSFFAAVVAMASFGALWRIGREDQGKVPRDPAWWRDWWKQVGIWGGLVLVACIVRTVKDPAKVLQPIGERAVGSRFTKPDAPAAVPPLGTITNGIGASFAVPAGQVAIFEVVTRKDGASVPVPPHCAYVLAGGQPVAGTFRWSREPEQPATGLRRWRIEVVSTAGNGATGGIGLAEEVDKTVAATGLALGDLEPNEETLHGDGPVALRVTTVAHNLKTGGSGVATTEWKKAKTKNK